MTDGASSVLASWSSFYVMTGSSAAALTGLMFVVITIVTGTERLRNSHDGVATFSTPTVLHFCAALLVSAILCAPWRLLVYPGVLLGLGGLWGIVYIARLAYRAKGLSAYVLDFEDWTWYAILPFVAYCAIFAGAIALPLAPFGAPFALAGGVVLLIFMGVRNAWDVVTFLAIGGADDPPASNRDDKTE